MRYILQKESGGDWQVWDVRRQVPYCSGLDLEEATLTKDRLNQENESKTQEILLGANPNAHSEKETMDES